MTIILFKTFFDSQQSEVKNISETEIHLQLDYFPEQSLPVCSYHTIDLNLVLCCQNHVINAFHDMLNYSRSSQTILFRREYRCKPQMKRIGFCLMLLDSLYLNIL